MNLDHTYIAIRRRSILEIVDLSFHVIREYFLPLSVLWMVGIAPFLLINYFLIGWLGLDYYDTENITLYFFLTSLLVIVQSQVATLPITIFLGKSMFEQNPGVWQTIVATIKTNLFIIWTHGILRMVIPAILLTMLINPQASDVTAIAATLWLSIMVGFAVLIRVIRPFASEILCLEKTPVLQKKEGQITYGVRSFSLHRAASGELHGRGFILLSFIVAPLTLTILGTLLTIDSTLNLTTDYETLPAVIYGPLACWLMAGIMAVVRFLSYIDIRIRQEGWEVELRLRAEAMRMKNAGAIA